MAKVTQQQIQKLADHVSTTYSSYAAAKVIADAIYKSHHDAWSAMERGDRVGVITNFVEEYVVKKKKGKWVIMTKYDENKDKKFEL